jgi:hypothetical protein
MCGSHKGSAGFIGVFRWPLRTVVNGRSVGVMELTEAQRAAFEELLGGVDTAASVDVGGVTARAAFRRTPAGRYVLAGLLIGGEALTADMLRQVPVARLEELVNFEGREVFEEIDALPRLRRESGTDPEEFSRLVVRHYRLWAKVVPNPATRMAVRAGVNVSTVHSWIREARLRGLLPPAKRGKAQ